MTLLAEHEPSGSRARVRTCLRGRRLGSSACAACRTQPPIPVRRFRQARQLLAFFIGRKTRDGTHGDAHMHRALRMGGCCVRGKERDRPPEGEWAGTSARSSKLGMLGCQAAALAASLAGMRWVVAGLPGTPPRFHGNIRKARPLRGCLAGDSMILHVLDRGTLPLWYLRFARGSIRARHDGHKSPPQGLACTTKEEGRRASAPK